MSPLGPESTELGDRFGFGKAVQNVYSSFGFLARHNSLACTSAVTSELKRVTFEKPQTYVQKALIKEVKKHVTRPEIEPNGAPLRWTFARKTRLLGWVPGHCASWGPFIPEDVRLLARLIELVGLIEAKDGSLPVPRCHGERVEAKLQTYTTVTWPGGGTYFCHKHQNASTS